MTKAQKILVFIAVIVIIALAALICLSLGGRNSAEETPAGTAAPTAEAEATPIPTPTPEPTPTPLGFTAAPEGYFEDALFIGDSRMVGIQMMDTIDGGTYFTSVGLSLTGAMSSTADVSGVGSTTLPALLQSRSFGKIYVMLGINDIGNNMDTMKQTYSKLVASLKEYQPDAIIYIMANLHVSSAQDSRGSSVNNTRLNELNNYTETLADGETVFYLDSNILFDDENGALSSGLTSDGIHVSASSYAEWGRWITQNVIVK